MNEDLTTMILLNTVLDIQQVVNMEEELLSQVILNPTSSTFLLQELMTATILNIKIPKLPKT